MARGVGDGSVKPRRTGCPLEPVIGPPFGRPVGGMTNSPPVNASLILFAKMAAPAAAVSRGLAADVVRSRRFPEKSVRDA